MCAPAGSPAFTGARLCFSSCMIQARLRAGAALASIMHCAGDQERERTRLRETHSLPIPYASSFRERRVEMIVLGGVPPFAAKDDLVRAYFFRDFV